MQKGQTLIFVLLGIVMMAFVGVAFYAGKITPKPPSQVVTSTPSPIPSPSPSDETVNWETYTNNKSTYRYQVKYPTNWQLQEANSDYVAFYPPNVNLNPQGVGTIGAPPHISIQISTMPMSDRPTGNESRQGIDFITDWKKINVNGIDGIYYQTHQCAPQCNTETVLPLSNGQQTVVISVSNTATSQGYTNIYNQILSTFKFK